MKLISAILDLFNPAGWAFKLLVAIIVSGGAAWGWHGFKARISAPAVAAALAKERATTTPAFKKLAIQFNDLAEQFKDIEFNIIETRKQAKAVADAAVAQEKYRADQATIKYQIQVRVVKDMATDRQAALVDFSQLPNSMWNFEDISAAHDSGGAGIVRLSGYTRRLIKRYQSCEQDLNEAIRTAAAAVDRAAIGDAAVRALIRP
jgi:hypothetical protein